MTGVVGFAEYNAGSYTGIAGVLIDWANGKKQQVTTGGTGMFYFSNQIQGANTLLRISYQGNAAPGITGVMWPAGSKPAMTGQTGVCDILSFYSDGSVLYGQSSLNFKY